MFLFVSYTFVFLQPNFCNFSDPDVYSPFYCNVPKDKNITCRHWAAFHKDTKALLSALKSEIDETGMKILEV